MVTVRYGVRVVVAGVLGFAGIGGIARIGGYSPPDIAPTWGHPGDTVRVDKGGVHCPSGDRPSREAAVPSEVGPTAHTPTPTEDEEEDGPFQILWDGRPIAYGVTTPGGGLVRDITVPGDASPGRHGIATRCTHSTGGSPEADFTVVPRMAARFDPSSVPLGGGTRLRVTGLYCRGTEPPTPGGDYTLLLEQSGAVLSGPPGGGSDVADFSVDITLPGEAGPQETVATVRCAAFPERVARATLRVTVRKPPTPTDPSTTGPPKRPDPTRPDPTAPGAAETGEPGPRSTGEAAETVTPTPSPGPEEPPPDVAHLKVEPGSVRPGGRVRVTGSGFPPACAHFRIMLGDREMTPEGLREDRPVRAAFAVPYRFPAGRYAVRLTCVTSGEAAGPGAGRVVLVAAQEVSARAPLRVGTGAAGDRFTLPATFASWGAVHWDARKAGLSLAGTILLVLLVTAPFFLIPKMGFPADIFNKSLENHPRKRERGPLRLPPSLKLFLFAATATALLTLVSPDLYPEGRFSAGNMVALGLAYFVAVLVATLTYGWIPEALTLRGIRETVMRVLPAGLLVAFGCAALSWVMEFAPGYVFGLVAAFRGVRPVPDTDPHVRGRAVLVASVLALCATLALLTAWTPSARAMTADAPGDLARLADLFLGTVTLTVLSTVVFGLLPMRFLDGFALFSWRKAAWLAVFAPSAYSFIYLTMVDTKEAPTPDEVRHMAILFVVFGAVSLITWIYVGLRLRRGAATA